MEPIYDQRESLHKSRLNGEIMATPPKAPSNRPTTTDRPTTTVLSSDVLGTVGELNRRLSAICDQLRGPQEDPGTVAPAPNTINDYLEGACSGLQYAHRRVSEIAEILGFKS